MPTQRCIPTDAKGCQSRVTNVHMGTHKRRVITTDFYDYIQVNMPNRKSST